MGANLKEVRERIKSVKSTQQITKAMKMVSAAKLRRAQDAIVQLRPYADKLDEILQNIAENTSGEAIAPLTVEREVNRVLIIVVTSNRGLCGAFNSNIIKAAAQKIEVDFEKQRAEGNITIVCIGKRGFDFFRKKFKDCRIVDDYVDMFSDLSFDHIARLANLIVRRFVQTRYDRVEVAYGRFKNAGVQFPEMVQFLPVVQNEASEDTRRGPTADYIFEPSEDELLKHLVPSILQVTFQKFLLDTHASEHGARMTAMDKATENADELLKDLRISYNKARQEAITKELSEIVGGAAALGG